VSDVPPSKARAILATYARPLLLLVVPIAVFTITRCVLLLRYPEFFATLTAGEKAAAFLQGLRYDASILFPVLGLPVLLLALPFPWSRSRRWQQVWGWIGFALFATSFFVLAADVVYFGYVQRHAGLETAALGESLKAVMRSGLTSHPASLLLFAMAIAALAWAWNKVPAREVPAPIPGGAQIAVVVVAAILMYYGERGTLGGKRLRMVTAFQTLPHPAAQLALNGPYCIAHSLVHARPVKSEFYPWPDALQTARDAIFAPGERAPDPEYPLLRTPNPPAQSGRSANVVVIMLESWDAFAVDAVRRELGQQPRGATPCFDAISREGVLFTRFYANGQRSMDGMSAILCGFPTLPGTSYLGRGLEQSTLTSLGGLARREGYETWFIQSSERDSFRCDSIAPRLGFDHYLGAEDIPPEEPAAPRGVLRGACWDHEMFAEAHRKLASASRPFVAFLYTNSTHPPFYWPEERWKKRSGDTLEDRYLNSLGYGDWALGRFFEGAKASGLFYRTIFIITADHVGGPGAPASDSPATKHHIPCLVLAPGLKPEVNGRIGSQLDVIPTVATLAGWQTPQAALGTSLIGGGTLGRGALCVEGNLVLRVEDSGSVLHDLSGRVASSGDATDAIERRLLSLVQVAYTLLRTNRISKP
jgi:phosphoglycerol transferase MdoB-like AlkP superfamily enzyme